VTGQGEYRMHDAPETWQGRDEKASKDRQAYRNTGLPVMSRMAQGYRTRNVQIAERSALFTLRQVPTRTVGTWF